MPRIIIICEGPTEREFCIDVLQPYFSAKDIYLNSPLIKKSGGGIVSWSNLKKQIENHLKSERGVYVTTLIDYYGIEEKHQYPQWAEAHRISHKPDRLKFLEEAMLNQIDDGLRRRYIPYIQLHEYESLLFSDNNAFTRNFLQTEFRNKQAFDNIFTEFPNPEDINLGQTTAPSKRLLHHIVGYDKVVYGSILAYEIGILLLRNKCPRFNDWLTKLEELQ